MLCLSRGRDVRQVVCECGALASLRSKYFEDSGSVSVTVSHIGAACYNGYMGKTLTTNTD